MAPFVARRNKRAKRSLTARLAIASIGFIGAIGYVSFGGAWSAEPEPIENKLNFDAAAHTRSFTETLAFEALQAVGGGDNPSGRRQLGSNEDEDDDEPDWGKAELCAGLDFPLFTGDCKVVGPKQRGWVLFLCFLGLLYLFVGIAIVCDELFVPALEIIAERNELSNDVAGATLMAAGGSAPELATSIIGTFKRSDVGFGTIVGSAVFNVLFVIGCCVLATPMKLRPLKLTWWPLFRDCCYYILTLCTLCLFMYTGGGRVELWEAIIQFVLYIGYVTIMMYSEQLYAWIKTTNFGKTIEASLQQGADGDGGDGGNNEKGLELVVGNGVDPNKDFARETKFRAGILNLLTNQASMADAAGVIAVAKVKGTVSEVFATLDTNSDGVLDGSELRALCIALGHYTEAELSDKNMGMLVQEIDSSPNPQISKGAFTTWYLKSEQRIRSNTKEVFDKIAKQSPDPEKVKTSDLKYLLASLGNEPTLKEVEEAEVALGADAATGISYGVFQAWYESSLFWTEQKVAAGNQAQQEEGDQESLWDGLRAGFGEFSTKTNREKFTFLFTAPLILFFCLIPDCRPPDMAFKCYRTFAGSIVGIAILSFLMVDLAEIVGATLGIPDVIMGLTILAAGTSVPDLLSSVIVARQGEGDMAVSSSIGSNIFDVCVGLPIPWMLFNIALMAEGCKLPVVVASGESMFISLVVLLCMVALVVVAIAYNGWKMTQKLGGAMFVFYFLYVLMALLTTPASDFASPKC